MVRTLEGKHPNYFEAVLQLRNVSKEVDDFTVDRLRKERIPVTEVKKVKNGKDFYIADKNFAKALGKQLFLRYGGEYRVTSSLFGRKDGKEIYRITVLFRGISFKKGDLVEYEGEKYEIKIMGRDILLQEIKIGKKIHLKYKDVKKLKKKS